GRERARLRAACLREQNDQVGMGGEVLKLRFQGDPDALERPLLRRGDRGERLLQLGGAAHEHRAEQTALRVEVVEQELLVDPGASRDLVHPRALEAAARELLARRRHDAPPSSPHTTSVGAAIRLSRPPPSPSNWNSRSVARSARPYAGRATGA